MVIVPCAMLVMVYLPFVSVVAVRVFCESVTEMVAPDIGSFVVLFVIVPEMVAPGIVLPDDFGTTNLNLKLALPCY